jgi:hypothetical protein
MSKTYIYSVVQYITDILSNIKKYIIEYFERKDLILQQLLESNDLFIFSNDFCKCKTFKIFNYKTYKYKCNLCCVKRVINFEEENDIYYFLENVKKRANLILHTKGGNTEFSDFIPYILKQKGIYINTYIPHYAYSAGSFIALPSNMIYLNWYSSMGPVDTQLEYGISNDSDDEEEETFPAKYIKDVKEKENAVTKLRSLEAKGYHSDDLFLLNSIFKNKKRRDIIIKHFLNTDKSHQIKYGPKDLQNFGLNIKVGIPEHILEIFNKFKINLKN